MTHDFFTENGSMMDLYLEVKVTHSIKSRIIVATERRERLRRRWIHDIKDVTRQMQKDQQNWFLCH